MKRKLQYIAASLLIAIGLAGAASLPVAAVGAAGNARNDVCAGITAGGGTCTDDGGDVSNVLALVIRILSIVVGVAAVIMIIVGGLKYVTSGGDSSKVSSAKNTILYAIIGMVIVAFAQLIVNFVLSNAT